MSRDSDECTLSNELKEKARIDLNEEDEKRDKDIEALRERLQNNKGKGVKILEVNVAIRHR